MLSKLKPFLVLSLICISASAIEIDISKYCAGQTRDQLRRCTTKLFNDYDQSDIELNKVYQQIKEGNRLTEEDKENLRIAQLNWINFRDNYCSFLVNDDKADIFTVNVAFYSCQMEITKAQTEQLKKLL